MNPSKKEPKLHMDPNEPAAGESCHSDRELRISSELLRGREAAYELLGIVRQQNSILSTTPDTNGFAPASELVTRIVDSFSSSLSMLDCQDLAARLPGESSKSSLLLPKGSRGCNKTRKRDSWTQVTSNINDGHEWRKYGQKPILKAKHPRSYYRCTHKPHCPALKRVQRLNDDDPPMYNITYAGHHTCERTSNPSSFSDIDSSSSVLFNFESANIEKPDSSHKVATMPSQQYTNLQQGLTSNYSQSENLEGASPNSSEWSFEDLDYIVGSVEFTDDHRSHPF